MDDQSLQGDHLCQSKLEFVSQKAEHPLRTLSVPGLEECAPRCWLRMPAEAAPQETPLARVRFNILTESTSPRTLWGRQTSQCLPPDLQGIEVNFTFRTLSENKSGSRSCFVLCLWLLFTSCGYF